MSQARRTSRVSRCAYRATRSGRAPSKQGRSPRPRSQPDENDGLSRVLSGRPLPSVAHWSRAPVSATTTTAAAPASFWAAVAVAMADKCSVMCRVLSLHFLVCLSVRLSFFFPSSFLPFLVSLYPLPLFLASLQLLAWPPATLSAFIWRSSSEIRQRCESTMALSKTSSLHSLFNAHLHCPSSSSRALFSFSLSSLAPLCCPLLLALRLLLTLLFLFFQIQRSLYV